MVAEPAHGGGEPGVARHHEPAVAHRAEVLGRVEGVAPEGAHRARRPTDGGAAVSAAGARVCAVAVPRVRTTCVCVATLSAAFAAPRRCAAAFAPRRCAAAISCVCAAYVCVAALSGASAAACRYAASVCAAMPCVCATAVTGAAPGAERLRGILDHRNPVRRREREDRMQIGALPEQVHGDDGPDASARIGMPVPPVGQALRVEVAGPGIDVDERGGRAETRHDPGGGEERVGRGKHEVAGADLQRHEGNQQRVGARGDRDGVVDLETVRHRRLERVDGRAAHVAPGADDVEDRPLHSGAGRPELGRQIEERDAHRQSANRIAIGMKTMPLTDRSGPVWRKPSRSYAATP